MTDIKSDESLICQYRRGDRAALDILMEKYKPMVIKKARTMFLMGGETEDLIQEGMIGLFKAVQDYDEGRSVSFYHFSKLCIERQIYTAVTTAGRKKHSPLNGYVSLSDSEELEKEESWGHSAAVISASPEETVIDREWMKAIREKLKESLSSLELSVLELFLEGYSYAQMAEKLGKKEKSIDNGLRRIKVKLQDIMDSMNVG